MIGIEMGVEKRYLNIKMSVENHETPKSSIHEM